MEKTYFALLKKIEGTRNYNKLSVKRAKLPSFLAIYNRFQSERMFQEALDIITVIKYVRLIIHIERPAFIYTLLLHRFY